MKKITLPVLLLLLVFSLSGCDFFNNNTIGTKVTTYSNTTLSEVETTTEEDIPIQEQIYNLAVSSGYTGSFEEWMASIKGATGDTGDAIVVEVSDGYIKWRYESNTTWMNLIPIDALISKASDGRKIEVSVSTDYIVYRYEGETEWKNLISLSLIKGEEGISAYDIAVSLGYKGTITEWLSSLVGKTGESGDYIVLEVDNSYIKWKYSLDTIWTNLISLDSLKGDKGETGDTGLSAYEEYIKNNPTYTKTETEWICDVVSGAFGTIITYKVSFVTDSNSNIENQVVESGKKAVKPIDPVKEGYTFISWYTNDDLEWSFGGYIVTCDITLYAKWNANTYTVTLDTAGGILDSYTFDVKYFEAYAIPTPTKEGYVLDGWIDAAGNEVNQSSYLYSLNKTFYAVWEADEYSTEWTYDNEYHWHASINGILTNVSDKVEHTWNEGMVTKEATYETEGFILYTCFVCEETKEVAIPILKHTYSEVWSYDENTHWNYSTDSGYESLKGNETEHTWGEGVVTTAATYDAEGVMTYTCSVCGATKTEAIAKLEHVYSEDWTADETNHWHACTDEGYTDLKADEAAHTWDEGVETKKGTLETKSEITYTCTVCGETKVVEGELETAWEVADGSYMTDIASKQEDPHFTIVYNKNTCEFTLTTTADNSWNTLIAYASGATAGYGLVVTLTATDNTIDGTQMLLRLNDNYGNWLTVPNLTDELKTKSYYFVGDYLPVDMETVVVITNEASVEFIVSMKWAALSYSEEIAGYEYNTKLGAIVSKYACTTEGFTDTYKYVEVQEVEEKSISEIIAIAEALETEYGTTPYIVSGYTTGIDTTNIAGSGTLYFLDDENNTTSVLFNGCASVNDAFAYTLTDGIVYANYTNPNEFITDTGTTLVKDELDVTLLVIPSLVDGKVSLYAEVISYAHITNTYSSGDTFDINHYWFDGVDDVYTMTYQDDTCAVTSSENKAEWSFIRVNVGGITDEFAYLKLIVKGAVGDSIIVKINNNPTYERNITFTGTSQIIYMINPANITDIIIFYGPGTAGKAGTFYIEEATLIPSINFVANSYITNFDKSDGCTYAVTENTVALAGTETKTEWSYARAYQVGSTSGLSLAVNVINAGEATKLLVKINDAIEYWMDLNDGVGSLTIASTELPEQISFICVYPNAGIAGECSMDVTLQWVSE